MEVAAGNEELDGAELGDKLFDAAVPSTSMASCASATRCTQARSASRTLAPKAVTQVSLDWSKWARQTHRWMSIALTGAAIADLFAMARRTEMKEPRHLEDPCGKIRF